MSGIRLGDLELSEMLDVIHFIFEEDMYTQSKEESEYKSKLRSSIYTNLYDRSYKYTVESSSRGVTTASGDILPPLDEEFGLKEFDPNEDLKPKKTKPKPYVPPTNFNPDSVLPFGKSIDAPLN